MNIWTKWTGMWRKSVVSSIFSRVNDIRSSTVQMLKYWTAGSFGVLVIGLWRRYKIRRLMSERMSACSFGWRQVQTEFLDGTTTVNEGGTTNKYKHGKASEHSSIMAKLVNIPVLWYGTEFSYYLIINFVVVIEQGFLSMAGDLNDFVPQLYMSSSQPFGYNVLKFDFH